MDLKIVLAAGVVTLLVLALPLKPALRATLAMALVLFGLIVLPSNTNRAVFAVSATSTIVLVLGAAALATRRGRGALAAFLPFGAVFAVLAVAVWPHSSLVASGTLNLLAAVGAWAAGALLARSVDDAERSQRPIALLIAAIVLAQLAICVLQAAGVGIFTPEGRTLDLEGGRSTGTFDHPSVIGKSWLLLLLVALPLSRSTDALVRRAAAVSVIAMLAAVGLSASRANFIAVIAALLIWAVISPSTGTTARRWGLVLLVGVVGLFFVGTILSRFDRDPAGGARDHFLAVALDQLARNPVLGIGPSRYLEVVGSVDELTAAGWPVHNAFVLEAVELGSVAAALLFLPLLIVTIRSVRRWNWPGPGGDAARAVIAVVPGLILIGVTGWGLVAPFTHFLWFFAFGLVGARLGAREPSRGPGALEPARHERVLR